MKRPGTETYPKVVGPQELEPYYSRHVNAMTREALHEKSDIALQLALRDKEIADLKTQLTDARAVQAELAEVYRREHEQIAPLLAAAVAAKPDHHYVGPDGAHMVVRGGSLDDFKRACGIEPQGAPCFQGETCSRSMPKASAEYGHLYTRGWCEWCNGEPHGAPPEGEWHTCCGNKLSFGQRCPDCRTIRYREC